MAKTSSFGIWLRKWRKARGLTQVELANKAGCGQSIISQYERGVKRDIGEEFTRPEPELVERLATALDRPVEEARALAGYLPSPIPPTIKSVQELISQHPGQGIVILPREQGQPALAVVDTTELANLVRQIMREAKGEYNTE